MAKLSKKKRFGRFSATEIRELNNGIRTDYLPPVIACRPRRPGDRGELRLDEKAQKQREKYFDRLLHLHQKYQEAKKRGVEMPWLKPNAFIKTVRVA